MRWNVAAGEKARLWDYQIIGLPERVELTIIELSIQFRLLVITCMTGSHRPEYQVHDA